MCRGIWVLGFRGLEALGFGGKGFSFYGERPVT